MGPPKQVKDAKRCLDVSRNPMMTNVNIKRKKPDAKINYREEGLCNVQLDSVNFLYSA